VGTEQVRVQADACDPLGNETRVLPRRLALTLAASADEQEFAHLLASQADVVVNRLPSLLGQLEADRPTGLPLSHGRLIGSVAVRGNVFDGDDIATAQLAVDRKI
jgi:hypothetical protein